MQKEYQVEWQIEVSANTPLQAAQEALSCITTGDSKVFSVTDTNTMERVLIDLTQGDFPVEDWKYEVANDDTILGYAEWNQHKLETEHDKH
jgi:acetyl-CoA acetyltransferase